MPGLFSCKGQPHRTGVSPKPCWPHLSASPATCRLGYYLHPCSRQTEALGVPPVCPGGRGRVSTHCRLQGVHVAQHLDPRWRQTGWHSPGTEAVSRSLSVPARAQLSCGLQQEPQTGVPVPRPPPENSSLALVTPPETPLARNLSTFPPMPCSLRHIWIFDTEANKQRFTGHARQQSTKAQLSFGSMRCTCCGRMGIFLRWAWSDAEGPRAGLGPSHPPATPAPDGCSLSLVPPDP